MHSSKIPFQNVGVVVSGGALPGRNPLIGSLVRNLLDASVKVYLIENGLDGIIHDKIREIHSLSNIKDIDSIPRCIIGSGRSSSFMDITEIYIKRLKEKLMDCLIVIGGDGSLKAAKEICLHGIHCIYIPSTLDADVISTDYWIGFDSVLNKLVNIVDDLLDSDQTHEFVQVITFPRSAETLRKTLAKAIPESIVVNFFEEINYEAVRKRIQYDSAHLKKVTHIVITERFINMPFSSLSSYMVQHLGMDCQVLNVTYLMKGIKASAMDRYYGNVFGMHTVNLITAGVPGRAVVLRNNTVSDIDIFEA